ncbi:hypothetical protein ACFY78_35115 [Streptomyces olindensis]|uniref:hypothetical protein n=1 Tax=Streptomyces olindensis TaxID=358823 RepID=UPI003674A0DB
MADKEIRPAGAADVPVVGNVIDAAFRPYVERIGRVPQPMEEDHAADVAAGKVFLTGEPVVGVVVVEAFADQIYPKYGYELVERRMDGPYDRVHYRKRLL